VGIDFASSAVELLRTWISGAGAPSGACVPEFQVADITQPALQLPGPFDLINVANVLFHIPEQDRFEQALRNLAAHLAPGGRVVTTEYMPRATRRTKWMLVRSRYEFADAVARAGMRIVDVRATGIFANDSFGLDGPDTDVRARFNAVRKGMQFLWTTCPNDQTRRFVFDFFVEIEKAVLAYSNERIAPVDAPSQKLVVLAKTV
jgi:SAM-dependent methyltransferase